MSSENKGADQLRSYCEADLRLCFRLCRLLVFPLGGSFVFVSNYLHMYLHMYKYLSLVADEHPAAAMPQ